MAVYAVCELNITNVDAMGPYIVAVADIITAHGGKYLVRPGIEHLAGNAEVLEGGADQYPVKVILEFPSMAAAKGWYNSKEYQAILPHRTNNAEGKLVFVEGN